MTFNEITYKIRNAPVQLKNAVDWIVKYLIVLPIKILFILLALTLIIVSCETKASVVPWNQIPFVVPSTVKSSGEIFKDAAGTIYSSMQAWCTVLYDAGIQLNKGAMECFDTPETPTRTWWTLRFTHGSVGQSTYNNSIQIFITADSSKVCEDINYPIPEQLDAEGQPSFCNRGYCGLTNSQGELVITIDGGTPTQMEVEAGSERCMNTGTEEGQRCINVPVNADGFGYMWSDGQGNGNSGQVCGSLMPQPGGTESGTQASGTDDAANCYQSGGSMNCYREPEEVCPGGACQDGCALFGGEAVCVIGTDGSNDGSGTAPGDNPPIGGDGSDGTGGSGGGDTGTGGGDGTGGTGGSGGGGGGSDGDEDDEDDNPPCEGTLNTDCGQNDFYEANDWDARNFETVLASFRNRVMESEIGAAATGFFSISSGGNCEVWSVSTWIFDITFDQHCSQIMASLFPAISAIMIALASFVGFRWAIL